MTNPFEVIFNELQAIKSEQAILKALLLSKGGQPAPDGWLDMEGLCSYLPERPAKSTIYAWVSRGEIPYHKRGKRLYFLQSELDFWLKSKRKKTVAEIEGEADALLIPRRKGGKL